MRPAQCGPQGFVGLISRSKKAHVIEKLLSSLDRKASNLSVSACRPLLVSDEPCCLPPVKQIPAYRTKQPFKILLLFLILLISKEREPRENINKERARSGSTGSHVSPFSIRCDMAVKPTQGCNPSVYRARDPANTILYRYHPVSRRPGTFRDLSEPVERRLGRQSGTGLRRTGVPPLPRMRHPGPWVRPRPLSRMRP